MRVMREESFGPVVGIQAVASDDEAVALMNDSRFGLTASVFTDKANFHAWVTALPEPGAALGLSCGLALLALLARHKYERRGSP